MPRSSQTQLALLFTPVITVLLWVAGTSVTAAAEPTPRQLFDQSERIVFLGDSITFAGDYVSFVEAWLLTQPQETRHVIINAGLPSETVSGLSEAGHAGGAFPRPVLAERLDRVLAVTMPDLVIACYGMNCGIYQPWEAQRFRRYQDGIEQLKKRVEDVGATLVLVTPPVYDDQRGELGFSYNEVLERYAAWLLNQRSRGWLVVDLHGPMARELQRRRGSQPSFTFQPDAVHPNREGHWLIATQLLRWLDDPTAAAAAESASQMLAERAIEANVLPLVHQRMETRRDAYLSAAGHLRPGIRAGLGLPEAEERVDQLNQQIRDMLASEPR